LQDLSLAHPATKEDLIRFEMATKEALAKFEMATKEDLMKLELQVAALKSNIIKGVLGISAAQAALIVTLLRLLK
jgi:methylglyoxal synthase